MTNKMTSREVVFKVQCVTGPGETVSVTGNCPSLGNWKHDLALSLQRSSEYETPETPEVWSGRVVIPVHKQDIKFRYFVSMFVESTSGHGKVTVMRRWETNLQPRLIKRLSPTSTTNEGGLVDTPVDVFGIYDGPDGVEFIEHGWLTAESVIQFKIANDPVTLWKKKYKNVPIRMKMVAVNLNRQNSISEHITDSMDFQDSSSEAETLCAGWPIIEVAAINENDYQLKLQEQFGMRHRPDEMMIFQAQVLQLNTVAFMIDFYADNNGDIPRHIGFCHILPSNLKETIGSITVSITSLRQEPIGQISVEYLVVKPLDDCPCDMTVSYSRYWKHQWTGLDIGHRGSGNSVRSFQACTNIRENTIASLQTAAEHGADFVEFDVQLSKDLIPVLFHDFHVNIGLQQKSKKGGDLTTLKIPVKDLTLKQLHELKVHLVDWTDFERYCIQVDKDRQQVSHVEDEPHAEDEEGDDTHDPFPTLEHAMEVLPDHVGFNVEIKWTMETKDGAWELENPFELNMYLDIVLQTVLKYGGKRRIVFSCFHPDICTMIRLKQNKYPVLFLTQGVTSKYPEYKDARTRNIKVAVYYALFAGILGLSVHTEDILRDPSQVQEIIKHGLIAFCWGDENNDANTIRYLKELGMHGVIYDRIVEHIPEKKSVFFTEHQYELLQIAATSPEAVIEDSNSFDYESHEGKPNLHSSVDISNGNGFSSVSSSASSVNAAS